HEPAGRPQDRAGKGEDQAHTRNPHRPPRRLWRPRGLLSPRRRPRHPPRLGRSAGRSRRRVPAVGPVPLRLTLRVVPARVTWLRHGGHGSPDRQPPKAATLRPWVLRLKVAIVRLAG